MKTEHYHVITGGPGSGKTTLISALRERGYSCVDEVGRQIIREQLAIGGDALHWGDQRTFAELMLSRSIGDYERHRGGDTPVFFDRGIAELTGYWTLIGRPVPPHFSAAARVYRYNRTVFIAPPWRAIFANDAERKQDFAEAVATCDAVRFAYCDAGYELVDLPKAPVDERVAFVLDTLGISSPRSGFVKNR